MVTYSGYRFGGQQVRGHLPRRSDSVLKTVWVHLVPSRLLGNFPSQHERKLCKESIAGLPRWEIPRWTVRRRLYASHSSDTGFISSAATAVRALTCSRFLPLLHLYSRNPLISCLSISRQNPFLFCSPVCSRYAYYGSKLDGLSLLHLPHTEGEPYSDHDYASTSHNRQALRQIVFVSGDIRNRSSIEENTLNITVLPVFL